MNDLFNTAPKVENARIAVLNGTLKTGYADLAANYLRGRGFNVVQVGNAPRSDYKTTTIFSFADLPQTTTALAQAMSVQASNIKRTSATTSAADIQVVIGADWTPPK